MGYEHDLQWRQDDGGDSAGFVLRHDRAVLRAMHETPEGYLLVEGFIAKPGILVYQNADGTTTRELVTAEVLHDDASLGTLGRKPVTLEHPVEPVGPENVNRLGVGDVGAKISIVEGGFVRIEMAVRNDAAIRAVKAGKHELSPGYRTRVDATPGVHPEFGPYDAVQGPRFYNHAAITERARGGRGIRLRADSAFQISDPSAPGGHPGAPPMKTRDALITLFTTAGLTRADSEIMADKMIAEKADSGEITKLDNAGVRAAFDAVLGKLSESMDANEKLTKSNGKMSGQLANLGAAAKQKKEEDADKADSNFAALIEIVKAGVDAGTEVKVDSVPLQARLDWAKDRAVLEGLATAQKLDAEEVAKLDSAALRKAIVVKAHGEDARTDAVDAYYLALTDQMSAASTRVDAAPYVAAFSAKPIPAPKGDERADGDKPQVIRADGYQGSLNTAFADSKPGARS